MKVGVIGASKVGRTLSRALRKRGHDAALRAVRRGLSGKPYTEPLVVIASRDQEVPRLAAALAARRLVSRQTVVLHVAGSFGPEALAPLAESAAGVGRAHPLVSFAAASAPPTLDGAQLLISGDNIAVRRARRLARALGMVPRVWAGVDPAAYHAAAALLANGSVALAAAAARLLEHAGAPKDEIPQALGPLLRSVAENVSRLGLPAALTGPIRRGDVRAVKAHLTATRRVDPDLKALYLVIARAQLPLARALPDASAAALKELAQLLAKKP